MNLQAMFESMDVNAAKAKYPAAWRCIEAQIVEVRTASGNAYVTPFVAQVVVVNGVETLKVTARTDLLLDEASDEPVNITFLVPTNPPRPMLSLVPTHRGDSESE